MEQIRVFIVSDDPEEFRQAAEILSSVDYIAVAGEGGAGEGILETLEKAAPDVILVGDLLSGDPYRLAEQIGEKLPGRAVILLEHELKEETVRRAMAAGARDVLFHPLTAAALVDAVYRGYEHAQKVRPAAAEAPAPKKLRQTAPGKVLTVFSSKGGVGKTFIASNLAVALARLGAGRVVLADLDLDFGNAALAVNVIPRYTVSDLVNDIRNLDRDLIESYLIPHRSGVKVLPANVQPRAVEFISPEHIGIILKVLKEAFDYIVVDMPARFYSPNDPVFREADLLLLVTTPEVTAVRNVKANLVALSDAGYPKNKVKLLLNRADPRGEIKPRDVEATLGQGLFEVLPADYRLVASTLNKGVPVVTQAPNSRVGRGLFDLARRVLAEHSPGKGRRRKK